MIIKIKMPTGKIPRMRSSAVMQKLRGSDPSLPPHVLQKIKSPGILPAV